MAVYFETSDARALLEKFDDEIKQQEPKGKITTWEKLADGKHYTHKALNWRNKAFFLPRLENGRLTFNIVKPKDGKLSALVYAYYHGHLTETFLNHFDRDFTRAASSALGTTGDLV